MIHVGVIEVYAAGLWSRSLSFSTATSVNARGDIPQWDVMVSQQAAIVLEFHMWDRDPKFRPKCHIGTPAGLHHGSSITMVLQKWINRRRV